MVPAYTRDQLDEAHRLRYQVYCVETGFEDPGRHPSGREYDGFDRRSAHSLTRHRPSGDYVGVVRLVLPDVHDPHAPFPLEARSADAIDRTIVDPRRLPRDSLAEISRFAVPKGGRRPNAEASGCRGVSEQTDDPDPKPSCTLLPHVTIGLFAGIVRISAERGITHWYAIMEPSLFRLLTRFGIHFQPIGPLVDYHGLRQPALGVADEVLTGIHRERPDVWGIITCGGRVWPLNSSAARSRGIGA